VHDPRPELREVAEIKTDPEFAHNFADATAALVDATSVCSSAADETRSGYIATAPKQRLSGSVADAKPIYQSGKSQRPRTNRLRIRGALPKQRLETWRKENATAAASHGEINVIP